MSWEKTMSDVSVVSPDGSKCAYVTLMYGPHSRHQTDFIIITQSLGHTGPIDDDDQGEERPKKGAAAARFPRPAVKILKDWMLQHVDHPYPTEEDKGHHTDIELDGQHQAKAESAAQAKRVTQHPTIN
jgi:hypothetical protein